MIRTCRPLDPRPPLLLLALLWLLSAPLAGQLPPDAVDLSRVKIPETMKSEDLCPVGLEPSAREAETWTYQETAYRGCTAGEKETFFEDPDRHAAAHRKALWVRNFMLAMSTIWCPITDEVTPGGRLQVEGLGHQWESCCSFCDEEMHEGSFEPALERLGARAIESFELTGGVYTEGASSPVEGAIRDDF